MEGALKVMYKRVKCDDISHTTLSNLFLYHTNRNNMSSIKQFRLNSLGYNTVSSLRTYSVQSLDVGGK
jgi:hypothetical protein